MQSCRLCRAYAEEQAQVQPEGVRFEGDPQRGDWIRRAGEDIRRGGCVLQAGMRLSPQALGLAASARSALRS